MVTLCWVWSSDPPPRYAEMSNEALAERAYLAKARDELERRREEARGPERHALERLLREAPTAAEVMADFTNTELVDLITSAPGAEADRAARAALAGRVGSTASPSDQQAFRELVVDRIADATYPDKSDQSEAATRAREEYVRLGHLAAVFLPESEALPIIKEMTWEQEIDGHIGLMARMLATIKAPGPDTITLVEYVFANWETIENEQYQGNNEHGETQISLYATLGHAGDAGLDALLRVGGWESGPVGLGVVARMEGDRPRDVLIAQYEDRKAEDGIADPFVLQALARRLENGGDPELVAFLRSEIPKHLTIPAEGNFKISSLNTGIRAASLTRDAYYLPYLRDFLKAVDNGKGLHGVADYKGNPIEWRRDVIYLRDNLEDEIARLENVQAMAAEAVPKTE